MPLLLLSCLINKKKKNPFLHKMAASSPTDVHVPARIVIVTTIVHSHIWVDKASRGDFHIDTGFVQVVSEPQKVPRFVVTRTNEKKIYTYKKPFNRKITNCQKRQLYGSTNNKNK